MGPGHIKVLLDTNVMLDHFIPGRENGAASSKVMTLCCANDVSLLYPLHSLNDVFYQVALDAKRWVRESLGSLPDAYAKAANARAWDCIDIMMEIGAPVGADGSDVWLAQHLREMHPDFEDNMVLAAAERAKADYLVTSDKQLIQKATVAALIPQGMLRVLEIRHG